MKIKAKSSGSFKNFINKMCLQIIYMHEQNLVLNNLQELMCLENKQANKQWKIWWLGSSNAGALGNAEYPFIAIAPRSILAQSSGT